MCESSNLKALQFRGVKVETSVGKRFESENLKKAHSIAKCFRILARTNFERSQIFAPPKFKTRQI